MEQDQEDAAMLVAREDSHFRRQTFTSITEKLEPVLIRGLATAKSLRDAALYRTLYE